MSYYLGELTQSSKKKVESLSGAADHFTEAGAWSRHRGSGLQTSGARPQSSSARLQPIIKYQQWHQWRLAKMWRLVKMSLLVTWDFFMNDGWRKLDKFDHRQWSFIARFLARLRTQSENQAQGHLSTLDNSSEKFINLREDSR